VLAFSYEDIAFDGAGNVLLVTVLTGTMDFDPGPGVDLRSTNGSRDVAITKLGADGSYAWTRTFGGVYYDEGRGIAGDSEGDVLVAGDFEGTVDFDPTDGVDERSAVDDPSTAGRDPNSFVTKLHNDGSYGWTLTFGGGNGRSETAGLAIDPLGNLLGTGYCAGQVDFDPSEQVDLHASIPVSFDIFVTKFATDGTYVWTRTFGGSGADRGSGVAVALDGSVLVTGTFRGTADFDPSDGVDLHTQRGQIEDIFVTKLHANGSYDWTRTWPVLFNDSEGQVAVDPLGNAIITGSFKGSIDFDPTEGTDVHTSTGPYSNAFVTKVYADGSYAWTDSFLSTIQSIGLDSAADADGNVLATGYFKGTTDFDPTDGVDERQSGNDIFVTMLTSDGLPQWTETLGGEAAYGYGFGIAVDAAGAIFVTGTFFGTVDFDPGCGVDERTSIPNYTEPFLTKWTCTEPRADFDEDGDVDLRDVSYFLICFTGEPPTTCNPGCYHFDFDGDDDVDLDDYLLLGSLSGP